LEFARDRSSSSSGIGSGFNVLNRNKGTIVVAWNYSPLALSNHHVDIYLYGKYCLKDNANFEKEVLHKIRCKTILSNLTKYLVFGKHYYEDTVVNTSIINDSLGDISHIQRHAVATGEV